MKSINTTASNGIILTTEDLKEAIKIADVNWTEAAYANDGTKSKDPIDICIFDFFGDSWDLVDENFVGNYDDCNKDKHIALAHVIEGRASVWHDWACQAKENEEQCYRVKGEPFSLSYAELFIKCEYQEYYFDDGLEAVLNHANFLYSQACHNDKRKCMEYSNEFVWGKVKYLVTRCYTDERIARGDADGQPDFITINVEAVED